MSLTEHLIVFVSIIVGLGLTDLLADLHRLIRVRRRVRWHAIPLLWAVVALLLVFPLVEAALLPRHAGEPATRR